MSPQERGNKIISLLFPVWLEANPDFLNYLSIPKETVSFETMGKQIQAMENWSRKGTCIAL